MRWFMQSHINVRVCLTRSLHPSLASIPIAIFVAFPLTDGPLPYFICPASQIIILYFALQPRVGRLNRAYVHKHFLEVCLEVN